MDSTRKSTNEAAISDAHGNRSVAGRGVGVDSRIYARDTLGTQLADGSREPQQPNCRLALIAIDWYGHEESLGQEHRLPDFDRYLQTIPMGPSSPPVLSHIGPHNTQIAINNADESTAARVANLLLAKMEHDRFGGYAGVAATRAGCPEPAGDIIERAWNAAAGARSLGGDRVVRWSSVARHFPSKRQLEGATWEEVAQWFGRYRQRIRQGYLESTMALVAAVEAREPMTARHAQTVSRYSCRLARDLGLRRSTIDTLKTAALLHDIGKIAIPDAILRKPGPLTEAEFEIMKQHPKAAVDILKHTSFIQDERPIILHHHERFDGAGYPNRLAGTDIPQGARILAVADTMDAMLSARTYSNSSTLAETRDELARCSGRQFDPTVASAAVAWINESPDEVLTASRI